MFSCAKCHAVVLLGDTEVGKTNMVSQFTQGQFDESVKRTLGVKPTLKMTQVGSSTVKVAVWDTAGQERYRAPVNYYYDAVAVVVVYDITSRKSFEDASKWLEEARSNADPGVVIMLVGNKSDLGNLRVVETKRAVRTEEGALFARKFIFAVDPIGETYSVTGKEKILFAEISAKYTSQVEGAFQTLLNSKSSILSLALNDSRTGFLGLHKKYAVAS